MILQSKKADLSGKALMPASKSHTIRALAIATLAHGTSEIANPLDSDDTRACVNLCRALGADIKTAGEVWSVAGTGGYLKASEDVINVMNSGTTLYVGIGMASLAEAANVFTGDAQIRRRSAQPLLDALGALGARAESTRDNGCTPIVIRGPLRGGSATIACPTSQYLTSLLIAAPLALGDTRIVVTELNEVPYVQMTLDWLNICNIDYSHVEMRRFFVKGAQRYESFSERINGDFSSATFFLCAAAVTGSDLTLDELDMNDSQGDKAVVRMIEKMGAEVEIRPRAVHLKGRALKGVELDLNATPDALPAMAIAGCFAEGTTRLLNVPQARMKETDRIKVMRDVITALGGDAEELPDGLVVKGSGLKGGRVCGHGDHRVVMACAVAGLASDEAVTVDTAEAMSVTFPGFVELMNQCGARMSVHSE